MTKPSISNESVIDLILRLAELRQKQDKHTDTNSDRRRIAGIVHELEELGYGKGLRSEFP